MFPLSRATRNMGNPISLDPHPGFNRSQIIVTLLQTFIFSEELHRHRRKVELEPV
jgi:hypothetical protein